jgi:glycosyltransferase involved in cell wall biosynthesis
LVSDVVFAGAVSNIDVPQYINAMDVALVSARAGDDFHYSPLKLREYLACGRAVIAPRLGEIPRTVVEGREALLYDPGDGDELAARLEELNGDAVLRESLGHGGRKLALATSTWDVRLRDLLEFPAFAASRTNS